LALGCAEEPFLNYIIATVAAADVPGAVMTVAMSYEMLAERLNITVASARRLVLRKRWKKTRGNEDGRTIIQVPEEFLARRDDSRADSPSDSPTDSHTDDAATVPETVRVTDILTRHIDRLEQELVTAKERAAEADALAGQVEALKAVAEELRRSREQTEADRDHWREQAARVVKALPAPESRTERRSVWEHLSPLVRRLTG